MRIKPKFLQAQQANVLVMRLTERSGCPFHPLIEKIKQVPIRLCFLSVICWTYKRFLNQLNWSLSWRRERRVKVKLPEDFWRTYSAMANTRGGYVVLGVREKKGNFIVEGISDMATVTKQLFDIANNKKKVNVNLLTEESLQVIKLDNKEVIVIEIPIARREQKPVYLNNQPMTETYLRRHEADCHCSAEQIKRMLAEQVEDSRDDRILTGFDFSDIDQDSLRAYRNLFAVAKPQHPWQELNLVDLFKNIGGWRQNRQSGEEGITLAGILMFGTGMPFRTRSLTILLIIVNGTMHNLIPAGSTVSIRMDHGQAMFLIFTAGLIEN